VKGEDAVLLSWLSKTLYELSGWTEAEPLMRHALAIDEKSFGTEHPNVARDLNNLATLLQATNRLAEAEPLMRRALAIVLGFRRSTGHEHPNQEVISDNYWYLLKKMGKSDTEIQTRIAEIAQPPK
jgi:tetratricopeptide (TPR) repeat protein